MRDCIQKEHSRLIGTEKLIGVIVWDAGTWKHLANLWISPDFSRGQN